VGITWAANDPFGIGDCDCGCVPAIYRPRHAASRWRAGLTAARGAALRLGRNVMTALPNAWPGFASEPGRSLADHSRLRPSDWPGPTALQRPKGEISHPAHPAPPSRQRAHCGQSSSNELRSRCEIARAAAAAAVERSWAAKQQAQETLQQVVRTRAAINEGLPPRAARWAVRPEEEPARVAV
jgi:hypothetical protein